MKKHKKSKVLIAESIYETINLFTKNEYFCVCKISKNSKNFYILNVDI